MNQGIKNKAQRGLARLNAEDSLDAITLMLSMDDDETATEADNDDLAETMSVEPVISIPLATTPEPAIAPKPPTDPAPTISFHIEPEAPAVRIRRDINRITQFAKAEGATKTEKLELLAKLGTHTLTFLVGLVNDPMASESTNNLIRDFFRNFKTLLTQEVGSPLYILRPDTKAAYWSLPRDTPLEEAQFDMLPRTVDALIGLLHQGHARLTYPKRKPVQAATRQQIAITPPKQQPQQEINTIDRAIENANNYRNHSEFKQQNESGKRKILCQELSAIVNKITDQKELERFILKFNYLLTTEPYKRLLKTNYYFNNYSVDGITNKKATVGKNMYALLKTIYNKSKELKGNKASNKEDLTSLNNFTIKMGRTLARQQTCCTFFSNSPSKNSPASTAKHGR